MVWCKALTLSHLIYMRNRLAKRKCLYYYTKCAWLHKYARKWRISHRYARVNQIRTFAWNVNRLLGFTCGSIWKRWSYIRKTSLFLKGKKLVGVVAILTCSSTFRTWRQIKAIYITALNIIYAKSRENTKFVFLYITFSSKNNICLALVFIGKDSAHGVVQDEIHRHLFLERLNYIYYIWCAMWVCVRETRLCLGQWR